MPTKSEQQTVLERIFATLETGSTQEIRRARRDLEKTLHQHISPAEHLEPLRELVLRAIQHSNEPVRDAAVWVGGWLNDVLRERARGKASRANAREEYRDYVRAIELLLDYYDDGDPTNEEAEFIDEMRPSPQKSLEMLLDRVTHGSYEIEITHVAPPDILARREQLETAIARLLDIAQSNFCFHDVIERIYHEEGPEDIEMIIGMFEGGGVDDEGKLASDPLTSDLAEVTDVVRDAWNYFPHESLGGLCPAEKGGGNVSGTSSAH